MKANLLLSRMVLYVLPGVIMGVLLAQVATHLHRGGQRTLVEALDTNGDGQVDTRLHWVDGHLIRAEYDRNSDGRMDHWDEYSDGIVVTSESDDNFDGKVDMWMSYRFGYPVRVQADVDWNGVPDVTTEYVHGLPTRTLWHPNEGSTVRIEHFTHGVKTHEQVDTNSGGTFDTTRFFDPFGNEVPQPMHGI